MKLLEELAGEIEKAETNTELESLARSLGFRAVRKPLRLTNGETVNEYAAITWDGTTSREVFGSEGRAIVHAMECLVSYWNN